MTKYVKVNKAPETLEKDCYVIQAPNFFDEIELCSKKKPKTNLMTPHYLREILGTIGLKYADESFSALTQINVSRCRGIPFEGPEGVHDIVMGVINKQAPNLVDAYVEHHLAKRPAGTKVVYFLGSHTQSGAFTRHGIDEIKQKEIDVYLGKKAKKVVGKPAITDEEASAING